MLSLALLSTPAHDGMIQPYPPPPPPPPPSISSLLGCLLVSSSSLGHKHAAVRAIGSQTKPPLLDACPTLDRCGKAYICGVGCGLSTNKAGELIELEGPGGCVVMAAAGELHGALVATGNRRGLYMWKLSTSDSMAKPTLETKVFSEERFRDISCGGPIGCAATESGECFMWAHGIPSLPTQPTRVCSRVLQVSCGKRHILALTLDKRLISWGQNQTGQLGRGSKGSEWHSKPGYVAGLAGVAAFSAGGRHSLAALESGELYAWGSNTLGQLMLGQGVEDALEPSLVEPAWRGGANLVAAGGFHSVVSSTMGDVWCCGLNNEGQLGVGDRENRLRPVKVDQPSSLSFPVSLSAGSSHSAAVTADFGVFTWGGGGKGQLGPMGSKEGLVRPRQMVQVRLPALDTKCSRRLPKIQLPGPDREVDVRPWQMQVQETRPHAPDSTLHMCC
jgi:alpha-tubulin suppressor-like RCC1 family protein